MENLEPLSYNSLLTVSDYEGKTHHIWFKDSAVKLRLETIFNVYHFDFKIHAINRHESKFIEFILINDERHETKSIFVEQTSIAIMETT